MLISHCPSDCEMKVSHSLKLSLNNARICQFAILVALAFLLPAVFDVRLSYFYYGNLRWVVFLAFSILAIFRHSERLLFVLVLAGACLFNPFLRIHMARDHWRLLDWICVVVLGWTILRPYTKVDDPIREAIASAPPQNRHDKS